MKVLLLEDDYIYNKSIKEYLEDRGFSVDSFYDGELALDAVCNYNYSLMILDIKVPKLNGHELIKHIKQLNIKTPIIIMTSLVDIDNITLGYELGCNDYLKKPFDLKELELRINRAIKTDYAINSEVCKLSLDYTFELLSGNLKKGDKLIDLTQKEKELLRYLIKNANYFSDIELLREKVWDDKEVNYADIRMHIMNLRQKTYKEFIISSRGLGYKIEISNS